MQYIYVHKTSMHIKYLLATLPQMINNLCGARHFQVENHWSKLYQENIFSLTERKSCIKIAPGTQSFFISYPAIHT